jgi:hypothetical protein
MPRTDRPHRTLLYGINRIDGVNRFNREDWSYGALLYGTHGRRLYRGHRSHRTLGRPSWSHRLNR